jgi:hypothetical protein
MNGRNYLFVFYKKNYLIGKRLIHIWRCRIFGLLAAENADFADLTLIFFKRSLNVSGNLQNQRIRRPQKAICGKYIFAYFL